MAHTDWSAIRATYCEGTDIDGARVWPSIEEAAAHHGISESSVRKMSASEGWPALKDRFCAEVEQRRRARSVATLAERGVGLDAKCLRVADALIDQVEQHVTKAIKGGELVAANTLATLGRALAQAQSVGRLAGGAPTAISEQVTDDQSPEAINKRVRAERLIIDRLTLDELKLIRHAQQLIEKAKEAHEAARNDSAQATH
jgi:hypothetical protein